HPPAAPSKLDFSSTSLDRIAVRPSETADRTLPLQRSTTSGGASRCAIRRSRRVTAHEEPSPSVKPTTSQNRRLNTQDAFDWGRRRRRRRDGGTGVSPSRNR